jgi:hypothetical protein
MAHASDCLASGVAGPRPDHASWLVVIQGQRSTWAWASVLVSRVRRRAGTGRRMDRGRAPSGASGVRGTCRRWSGRPRIRRLLRKAMGPRLPLGIRWLGTPTCVPQAPAHRIGHSLDGVLSARAGEGRSCIRAFAARRFPERIVHVRRQAVIDLRDVLGVAAHTSDAEECHRRSDAACSDPTAEPARATARSSAIRARRTTPAATACAWRAACGTSAAGTSVVQASEGEECDNGVNDNRHGGCLSDCTLAPHCGDGQVQRAYGEPLA